MKSVVTDLHAYDWEGDVPLKRPWSRTIIYETHVRSFTAHPSSGLPVSKRGTYAALADKIPTFGNWELPSNCFPSFSLIPRTRLGPNKLLGLFPSCIFCTAPGIQFASGTAGGGR